MQGCNSSAGVFGSILAAEKRKVCGSIQGVEKNYRRQGGHFQPEESCPVCQLPAVPGREKDQMKLGLHIHSKYSHDSKVSVEEILEAAENAGFDAIAITDHNTATGGLEAQKGEQVCGHTHSGVLHQYGHVLAYFIDDSIEKRNPQDKRQAI